MSTAPMVTIKVLYPGNLLNPSYLDARFTNASIFGTGTYDAWCADLDTSIDLFASGGGIYSNTFLASVYATQEWNSSLGTIFPTIETPQNLDVVNWLINQNFTAGASPAYTSGEVQAAIWQLLGDDWVGSPTGPANPVKVNTLISLALAQDGYKADITDADPTNDNTLLLLAPFKDANNNGIRDANEPSQQPILITITSAALGDRVWHDVNANGNQDAGEAGIAGAIVKLVRDLNNDGDFDDANEVLATTTTDSNGLYKFVGLTPGLNYQVQFFMPAGYDAASPRQTASSSNGLNSDGPVSDVVVLAAGQYNSTIDAGFYKHVSVGNYVWHDTDQDGIQDATETGIGGVKLTLIGYDGSGNLVVRTTTTAADGSYLFSALMPGTYQVSVDSSNFDSAGALAGYTASPSGQGGDPALDSNPTPSGTTPAALLSGSKDLTLDFGFYKPVQPTASLGDRVWHDLNANGVQDANEGGIDGIVVKLYDCTDPQNPVYLRQTTTANGGLYSFTNLVPGKYQVQFVTAGGYVLSTANVGDDAFDSDAGANGFTGCYTLTSGETNNTVDAGLYRPASLGDRVWYDNNRDGLQDANEPGVAGLTVTLIGGGADGLINGIGDTTQTTTTNLFGYYEFTGLTPGVQYQVQFTAPDGYGFTLRDVNGNSQDSVDSDANPANGRSGIVTLSSGEFNRTIDAGVVNITPGIEIIKDALTQFVAPNKPVTFTYSVRNTGGVPLSNIVVTDDAATPDYAADDFNPTPLLSGGFNIGDLNKDNKLDVDEVWKYSATVIPPVNMTVTISGTTYESGSLIYTTLANGDIRVTYLQSNNFNDNTYGTGSDIGWTSRGKTHKFSDLTNSDYAGFEVRATDGTVLFKFKQDYITASSTNIDGYTTYSGYQSLGIAGGDGGLVTGGLLNAQWATFLYDFDSTLELNLNQPGTGTNGVLYRNMTVNSPINDPNWNEVNGYMFTIRASAFDGRGGFGGVTIWDQHNSPAKIGDSNSYLPNIIGGPSVNTATVTGVAGGTTVTDDDDATVAVITGPLGSLGDRVWFDRNANGIQDASEMGIVGVRVRLEADFDMNGTIDYMTTTVTGADGFYTFTGLPAGEYKVSVDASTLPANYVQTYDLDGLSSANTALGELTSGQNRTDFDFGYVASAPGFKLVKTADKTTVGYGQAVTYTYEVFNTGATPLSNVVLRDDNATPHYTADDFMPTYVGGDDGDGLLETGEVWRYQATVIPPQQMTVTISGTTYDSGTLTYATLANGDIRVTYLQSNNFNDNTYGTGSDIGWTSQGKTHKFGDLTGSDKAGFEVRDSTGKILFKFYQDYITASTTNLDGYSVYSGYQSLGFSGGDGSLVSGGLLNAQASTYLYDFDSTLETNLNQPGTGTNGVLYRNMTVNSPINDPNWNDVNGYSFVIKASAFNNSALGTGAFGGVTIFDQHNSPAKTGGSNSYVPTLVPGESTNTALVTATLNGQTVVALDSATVVVGPTGGGGGMAKFFVVDIGSDKTYKYSAAGTSVGDFALTSANKDARDVATNTNGSTLWVLDKSKNVHVYNTATNTQTAVWKADSLGSEPEGITLDGNHIWAASRDGKIGWYKNAANNLSGTDKSEKQFAPSMSGNLKGIVTDGTYLWVVTEGSTDYVYRFTITRDAVTGDPTGLTQSGLWTLATANSKPTGITLDPTGASQSLWVVDESTDTVYEYANARSLTSGQGVVSNSFKLAGTNLAPQGIADPLVWSGASEDADLPVLSSLLSDDLALDGLFAGLDGDVAPPGCASNGDCFDTGMLDAMKQMAELYDQGVAVA